MFCISATSTPPFLYEKPPEEGRKIFNDVQKESIAYSDGITTSWIDFKDHRVKLIKPKASAQKKLPVLFYIHGGGWVFGSPDAFGRLLGELAKRADAAVFAIDYTLSPEAKYPTALDQAWATLEFIEQNAEKYNVWVVQTCWSPAAVQPDVLVILPTATVRRSPSPETRSEAT